MAVVVLTTVKVRDGQIDAVGQLFEQTNRALVEGQPDWRGAWFTANREKGEITNVALWDRAESYERLRSSDEFKATMSLFADKFAGPPTVSINEVLVEMLP